MSMVFKFKEVKPQKFSFIRKRYREETDENGCPYLVEDGSYDERKEIQSYYESVQLDKILERIAYGDTSILRPESSLQYGDDILPSDPFELLALKKESERKFDELPTEIKELYNNDINQFANDLVTKGIEEIGRKYSERAKVNSGTTETTGA